MPDPSLTTTDFTSPVQRDQALTDLQLELEGVEADILTLQAADTSFTTQIGTINSGITAVQGVNTTQDATLTSLQTQINDLSAIVGDIDLTVLTGRVTAAEADIDALQSGLTSLTSTVSALSSTVSTLSGQNLNSRLTTVETTVSGHTSSITSNVTAIGALQAADISLGTRVTASEGNITSLQATVSTHTTTLSSHTTSLAALAVVDSSLDARLDALEAIPSPGTVFGGIYNNSAIDNTAAFLTAVALAKPILFASGRVRMKMNPIDIDALADPHIFDKLILIGGAHENTLQHLEEGGASTTPGMRNTTTLEIELPDESSYWLKWLDTEYRAGPWEFRDITIQIVGGSPGSGISIGDPDTLVLSPPTMRGFYLDHAYISRVDHQANEYMIDEPSGWVINPDYVSRGIRLSCVYDIDIKSSTMRGFRSCLELINCDSPCIDDLHLGIAGDIQIYTNPGSSANAAPPRIGSLFFEGPFLGGYKITDGGAIDQAVAEIGNYTQTPVNAPRPMLADVTWSIGAGATYIQFEDLDALDNTYPLSLHIPPRSAILLTPDETVTPTPTFPTEPDIPLLIIKVEDDTPSAGKGRAYFRNSNSSSYIKRALSGDGAGVTRYMQNAGAFSGYEMALGPHDLHLGTAIANLPMATLTPQSRPMTVGDSYAYLSDESNKFLVVMSSGGIGNEMGGGVNWMGSRDVPDHPFCYQGGLQPKYNGNFLFPSVDPYTGKQRAGPGRGVQSSNNNGRDQMIHWIQDTSLYGSPMVPCYRLSDGVGGHWTIPGLRRPSATVTLTIRAYATTSATLVLYGYVGSTTTQALSTGWTTFTKTLTGATQMSGSLIDVGGADIYVASVILDQGL